MPAESRSAEKQDEFPARVSDALIGAVIGLVLIYVGTRISYWIFRWLVIGIGLLFVGVMSAFVISVAWEKGSPTGRRILSGARGHVRKDPQLGTLIRDVKAEAWVVDVRVGGRTVEFLIDGKKEPNPELVTRARQLVADFRTFERRLNDYLAETAKEWASENAELGADVSQLRLSSIKLRLGQPILVDLDGPDEDVYWSCEYADGEFSGLDFD